MVSAPSAASLVAPPTGGVPSETGGGDPLARVQAVVDEVEKGAQEVIEGYLRKVQQPLLVAVQRALEDAQRGLEEECLRTGVNKYREKIQKFRTKETESLSDPVQHLIRIYLDPVSNAIIDWIRDARKKPGPRTLAATILEEIDRDVAALIALRRILDGISKRSSLTSVAHGIGFGLETEARLMAFEANDPQRYKNTWRYINNSPHSHKPYYRRQVLVHTMNRHAAALWQPWSVTDKVAVGTVMVGLVVENTGLIELEQARTGKRVIDSRLEIRATSALQEWLSKQHTRCELLSPFHLPMLCPPLPHRGVRGGGYLTPQLQRPLLRIKANVGIDVRPETMPTVFRAINTLQAVPYQINAKVLEVLWQLWDRGQGIPGYVDRHDKPLPPKPAETSGPEYRRYKHEAKEIHIANVGAHSRQATTAQLLAIARRFVGKDIYFPMHLDFRGRMYCVPRYLHPQGSDPAKGLLKFAHAKPLGDRGLWWLKVHVANCFGVDKVSLEERVWWTEQHHNQIVAVARDPFACTFWHDADDQSCQALAACFEYFDCVVNGEPSSLVIWVDGTCNGIQHLAALSRDAEAGAHVNLIPAENPGDIYSRVAEEVVTCLSSLASSPLDSSSSSAFTSVTKKDGTTAATSDADFAKQWLAYGITRDITKRPTMILPYGGTLVAIRGYVEEFLRKQARKGKQHPFGADTGKAVIFLTKVIWAAMEKVVEGPCDVRRWTKVVASLSTKEKRPLQWTTPSGFVVHQAYPHTTPYRVTTRLGQKTTKLTLLQDTDKLDPRRQANSLAPNWIHSMDAAALHLTVVEMERLGISEMAAVHDSYGAHAADMDTLGVVLREQFVRIYRDDDWLQRFRADCGRGLEKPLPEPPPVGNLDVGRVLESRHFFA